MRKQKIGSGVGFGNRTLKVEQLEQRAMLAGNVAVSVTGGNLIITGDNHDNAVLIQEVDDEDGNANTHAYLITGFDFADAGLGGFESGPTNITGGGEEVEPDLGGTSARVVTGVTANIIIDLKKGNDALGVGNSVEDLISLADDCGFGLGIGSGSGSFPGVTAQQVVQEGTLTTPASLIINMGDGNNAVAVIADVGVNNNAGSLVINTGNNADAVAVGGSSEFESDSFIHGDLAIVTQKGDDNICVHNATIFGAMAINAGDGFNDVSGENFRAAAATVVAGKNSDDIFLGGFALDTALTINAGNGNNNVLVEEFNAGQGEGPNELPLGGGTVTIVTGSGNDNVGAQFFIADNVVISTGSGNDGSAARPEAQLNNLQPIEFFGPITVLEATITYSLVVSTGNGNDLVNVEDVSLHDMVIDTGAGNDGNGNFPIEVNNVTVAGNATMVLGAGNDDAEIIAISVGLNLTVNAGAGNDFVALEDSGIGLIATFVMGAGNDELDIFSSGGTTPQATLVADGGSGRDSFFNDLGIDSNGNFDFDPNGVPHEIIRNFEFFEADAVLEVLATPKKGGGW